MDTRNWTPEGTHGRRVVYAILLLRRRRHRVLIIIYNIAIILFNIIIKRTKPSAPTSKIAPSPPTHMDFFTRDFHSPVYALQGAAAADVVAGICVIIII